MAQEYTFVVDGTHRTTTVTAGDFKSAVEDAANLLLVDTCHISWLRPLPSLKRDSETTELNTFYSGVEE